MTTTFDNRRELEKAERKDGRLHAIGRWLAEQWPKAAITFGIALTIVWTAVLAWLVGVVVGLV